MYYIYINLFPLFIKVIDQQFRQLIRKLSQSSRNLINAGFSKERNLIVTMIYGYPNDNDVQIEAHKQYLWCFMILYKVQLWNKNERVPPGKERNISFSFIYLPYIQHNLSHMCTNLLLSSPVSGTGNLILSKLRENCRNWDTFRNSFLGVFLQQKNQTIGKRFD